MTTDTSIYERKTFGTLKELQRFLEGAADRGLDLNEVRAPVDQPPYRLEIVEKSYADGGKGYSFTICEAGERNDA